MYELVYEYFQKVSFLNPKNVRKQDKIVLFFFCFAGSLRKLDQRFSEFKFLQEPEDVVVVRNKPAILHCEASLSGPGSSRNVKIKWKRDGEFLNFPDFNDRR